MSYNKRMAEALSQGAPDRTPFFEYVLLSPISNYLLKRPCVDFAGDAALWFKYANEAGWDKAVRQYAADKVDIAELLGHDVIYAIPNPLPSEVESYVKVKNMNIMKKCSYLDCDPIEVIQQRNDTDETALEAPINTDMCFAFQLINEEIAKRGLEINILAPAYFHGVWTDVDLLQTIALSPKIAHRHFKLATKKALRYIEAYIGMGIELIGIGGDFAGNRPIISPEAYSTFIVPEVRILSDKIREAGKYSINASDGNLWSVIDEFIIGCGVDGYLEIDSRAGMSLEQLKARFGSRTTFFGNMDCGQVLTFSSPEEIVKLTIKCLQDGLGNGGHVFCASNAITDSVPFGNYMAMVNAYKGFFGLPAIKIG